jgi:hypothetical protein
MNLLRLHMYRLKSFAHAYSSCSDAIILFCHQNEHVFHSVQLSAQQNILWERRLYGRSKHADSYELLDRLSLLFLDIYGLIRKCLRIRVSQKTLGGLYFSQSQNQGQGYLLLAVYRQSVHLRAKPLEDYDQRYYFSLILAVVALM